MVRDAYCDYCESRHFTAEVNGVDSVRLRCSGCEEKVAWLFNDEDSNKLIRMEFGDEYE